MNQKPKFIYFDLDDTLLDHKRAEAAALTDVYHYFPLFKQVSTDLFISVYASVNSRQWMLYGKGEIGREQLQRNRFEQTLNELELDSSNYAAIGRRYMQYYRNHWQWIDGAKQAFDRIRARYGTGILTNGFSETQKLKFERFDLYNQSKHLVISEEVGVLKPNPGIFDYATKLADCTADEILYIGDSYTSDVLGGAAYGWNVAWYTQNGAPEEHEKADFIFSDFNDLTNILNV